MIAPAPPSLARPAVLTVVAVLELVGAAFCLMMATLMAMALLMGARAAEAPPASDRLVQMVAGGAFALLGGLQLVAAIGLLARRPWGRVAQIALSCIGLLGIPLGTIIHALVLVYLFKPGVKVLYSGRTVEDLSADEMQAVRDLGGSGGPLLVAAIAALLVVVLVAWIGIVAAIAIPNLLNAIQRGKQKRTMSDLRSIGVAVESYQVNHGHLPMVETGDDAAAALRPLLEPTYLRLLPSRDAWQHRFRWERDDAGYRLVSYGKDGQPDADPAPGATTNFNADIYFENGRFTRFPEGTQH